MSFPPPAIGEYLSEFSAGIKLHPKWVGTGSFTYNGKAVDNVPTPPED